MSDSTHLDRIITAKRAELSARRGDGVVSARELEQQLAGLQPVRDFEAALRAGPAPRIIAEFKRASPSAGPIREGADVATIVKAYEDAGAAAVSVLTDRHFDGSLADLEAARAATSLPILRKDFILERSQILEARRAGADAVLLIVAALEAPTLKQLIDFAREVGVHVLCEAHDSHEVDRAMSAGARIVGVNNRDLKTFEIDRNVALEQRPRVPRSFTFVAESGIEAPEHLRQLRDAGVDAALVGTLLMGAEDPGAALASVLDAMG
ncbi:MAG: indole-3-glycerol phosphate synthase TrpC [Nannocystaceae bacterium]|nr:indole-3-glycerol phosphate synthase TrpC [bacterium]